MKTTDNLSRPRLLESERLFLTPPTMDDLDTNFEWENDRRLSLLDGGIYVPKSYAEVEEKLKAKIAHETFQHFSVIRKADGLHIGNAAVFDTAEEHGRCRWGVRLGREYHRQGYGREVGLLIIRYVFDELGLRRLMSETHAENPASMKFQESLGFVLEGRLRQHRLIDGEYVDHILYGMNRDDYDRLYGLPH